MFAWGSQPTRAHYMPSQLEQRQEEMEYLMKLARSSDACTVRVDLGARGAAVLVLQ